LEENSVSLTVVKFSLAPRKMPRATATPRSKGMYFFWTGIVLLVF